MATRPHTEKFIAAGVVEAIWTAITTTDRDGSPLRCASHPYRTVLVRGTPGGGSPSLAIEGSDNGTNWVTLDDNAGAALTFTAAGSGHCETSVPHIRPNLSGGDGTTNLTVAIYSHAVPSGSGSR